MSLPIPAVRPLRTRSRSIEIAPTTGPLDDLSGCRVLVLADDENLRYSARDLGYKLSHRLLAERFNDCVRHCTLHAFFSRQAGDERRCDYFRARGWMPHPRDIQLVHTRHGVEHRANADNSLLFKAGVLVSRTGADAVVLASGDGDLVCDLARELHELPKPRKVYTLSLAGSTSFRLDARRNADIDGNIEVGLDCLHALEAPVA